ncbi:DUF262 domain-containing protein [Mycoplasma sp. Z707]|uniref:DUF262 domain-containing protein n=1 Tax=Mycoplasma sp. Z707 TaxID=3401691 RepID=UPI003AAE0A19
MNAIKDRDVLIPHIQRRYVWKRPDIEMFVDSLYNEFPCPPILSWSIDISTYKNKIYIDNDKLNEDEVELFEIGNEFMEDLPAQINKKADFSNADYLRTKELIFDGQQRLTSLRIAFGGGWIKKHKSSDGQNRETYRLYLALDKEYKNNRNTIFEFKIDDKKIDKSKFFQVSLLDNYLRQSNWIEKYVSMYGVEESGKERLEKLERLYLDENVLGKMNIPSNKSFDNVVDIFVRLNNGGTPLDSWELIYSKLVAHWNDGKKAIDNICERFNTIAQTGNKFERSFIISTCVYLVAAEKGPIRADIIIKDKENLNNFIINAQENWKRIEKSLEIMAAIINPLYSKIIIPSDYALLPVIYYIYRSGKTYDALTQDIEFKNEVADFLFVSFIKNAYSSSPYTLLGQMRNLIDEWFKSNKDPKFIARKFNTKSIFFHGNERFMLSKENIRNILSRLSYGNNMTSILLSNLNAYKGVKNTGTLKENQDHIFPQNAFHKKKFEKILSNLAAKYSSEEINAAKERWQDWNAMKNRIGNLQILSDSDNKNKGKKLPSEWLSEEENKDKVIHYMKNNKRKDDGQKNINLLDLVNFDKFIETRERNITNELLKRFNWAKNN